MSTLLENTIAIIEKQQKGLSGYSPVYQVGEQLKEIAAESELAAQLLFNDLENPGMTLKDAEKRIKVFADDHRSGNSSCVPWQEADRILRELYAIPGRDEETAPAAVPAPGKIDLASFF